jgi:lysophospholipid acyltransferase (LPLAT)-like uncharacterized protein
MQKRSQRLLASRPFSYLVYRIIRIYSRTLRFEVRNSEAWMEHHASGGSVLLCTWHQHFFAAIRHFKTYAPLRPSLMISRSLDGTLIANVAALSGWTPVRGSSSLGGKEALEEMIDRLRLTRFAAHVVDGPRGPAGVVKAGLIRLAQGANAVIFPFYVEAPSAWYFNSWDRFFIPKPFSRVVLRFGEGIDVPSTRDPEEFEALRLSVEGVMRREAGMEGPPTRPLAGDAVGA